MKRYDIAAYIWPAFTGDEHRTRLFWPEGIGEWESVKNSVRKYEGDTWPRKPLWGYVNEADPRVMEMEIEEAVSHGINVFVYDWYWYDRRPFLENCLNDGFLKAENRSKMKFYLMWANHNATNAWSREVADTDAGHSVVWQGDVDEREFEVITDRLIERYFLLPEYYRIEGKPVFMIYDIENLLKGLGGLEKTKEALARFKEKCRAAGLPGLHLQFTQWGDRILNLSGVDGTEKPDNAIAAPLGFDSLTNYQLVQLVPLKKEYSDLVKDASANWEKWSACYGIPYFPHVSIGWDNNPRSKFLRTYVAHNNTPEEFEKALRLAKAHVDSHSLPAPLITVNSWNEWTESSYLEPDDRYGYAYLEAVKRVFCE